MSILIYGAYGYTGALTARMAVEQGLKPVLAGRDAARLETLAQALNLEARPVGLEDTAGLDQALDGMEVVLHCAGPFVSTCAPMAAACLRTGTHYLDITGEIGVFEALAGRDEQARTKGVMLMPGVGFDVVPSDCLAAHVKRRLPEAVSLDLAIKLRGRASGGTLKTMVQNIGRGGAIRKDGVIVRVPTGWRTRTADFGKGPEEVVSIPWGDVSTAFYSTGIPNIITYALYPEMMMTLIRRFNGVEGLLARAPAQRFLEWLVKRQPAGPTDAERERGQSLVWAQATDPAGRTATARYKGPEGYTLTAMASLEIARRVVGGGAQPGYQTPSRVFGPDFALSFGGTERIDLD